MYKHSISEELSPRYKQKLKTVFLPTLRNALKILPARNPEEISSVSQKLSDFLKTYGYQNPSSIYKIVRSLTQEFAKLANDPNNQGQYNLVVAYLNNAIETANTFV